MIRTIRAKLANGEFEMTIPHFIEELAEDDLLFVDVESAIAAGEIRRKFTRDPRGTRYEVTGPATDGRMIAVVCRIKSTGKLLLITAYALD